MASITITTTPRNRPHRITSAALGLWRTLTAIARQAATPHKAALANLTRMPLTLAGTGCVDFAAFHVAHGWGWLVTGLSLVFLEHLIADEQ